MPLGPAVADAHGVRADLLAVHVHVVALRAGRVVVAHDLPVRDAAQGFRVLGAHVRAELGEQRLLYGKLLHQRKVAYRVRHV